jgi:FtsH-binding integral membrane protein
MTIRNRLLREVRKTRRRIQFERFLKGIAVTAAIALAASLVASYVLSQNNFSDTTIFWSRVVAGLVCLVVFFRFVLWPLVRIPSTGSVARFLEERNPHLEDRLATAVENLERPGSIHPAVHSLLLRDAGRELAGLDKSALLYPQVSLISLLGFVVTGTLFL